MHFRSIAAAASGLSLMIGSAGCATSDPDRRADGGAVLAVRDGETRLAPGTRLSVRLPSNPSTGFAWVLKAYDGSVLRPASPFNAVVAGVAANGAVGVPGETRWVFDAATAGATVLTFEYRRAWSDAAAVETARFTVTVDASIAPPAGGAVRP